LPEAIFLMLYWLRSTLVIAVDDGGDHMIVMLWNVLVTIVGTIGVGVGVVVSVSFGVVVVSRVVS
jgi:hypothetical protein